MSLQWVVVNMLSPDERGVNCKVPSDSLLWGEQYRYNCIRVSQ